MVIKHKMEERHKHEQTIEEERQDVEEGKSEKNMYSEAGREELIEDDDEITDMDEGFMKGYDEGCKMTKCPVCQKILEDDLVEREINGEIYRFCSDEHAEKFAREHGGPKVELEVGNIEKEMESEKAEMEDIEKDKRLLKKTE